MKGAGMLVFSLRGVNFGLWSHLGCSGQNYIIFSCEVPKLQSAIRPVTRGVHGPNTAAKALKECDDDLFPNIYVLLKICATIPATSRECERSAHSLR